MSQEDDASKTEEPTEKKLREARERGQVASSQEVNHWMVLFGGLVFTGVFLPPLFKTMGEHFAGMLASLHQLPDGDYAVAGQALLDLIFDMATDLIAPTAIMIGLAAGAGIAQFGFLLAPEAIKPKGQKISPKSGLQRIFGSRGLVEFGKGIVKILTVGVVGTVVLWPFLNDLSYYVFLDPNKLLEEVQFLAVMLFIAVLIVMAIIAALDLIFQHVKFQQDMRMTKQEVQDEQKQTQGDPQVKKRLAELRQEKAKKRMMQEVPSADAVVTNPTHYAVALAYRPGEMNAPIVVAKGLDEVAQRIIETAEANDVPVIQNPPLARALYDTVELDHEITPENYKAVAEIISYVYRLKGKSLEGAQAGS